jgi:hypothetical protein
MNAHMEFCVIATLQQSLLSLMSHAKVTRQHARQIRGINFIDMIGSDGTIHGVHQMSVL